jgi:acetylornithine/succinyldiaminopimelate/putrescine aminotransferase
MRAGRGMIDERADLYGADSPQALAAETYENYKRFVNPPLARVMKLSGSPVEVRASGCTIWDENGKAYLDFAGGYGVFTLGHSHPRAVAAVRAQLELMSLSGKTMFNVLLGRAARRLAELAPGDLQISFWCNSGTEAIEGAIKLARAATGRARRFARCLPTRSRYPTAKPARSRRPCAMPLRSSSSRCKAKAASTCLPRAI